MDSHQLLDALHDANRLAGCRPVDILIEPMAKTQLPNPAKGAIKVRYLATTGASAIDQGKPKIQITYKS